MKLSIIIPTYNSASVLAKALDSIVKQNFTDWEVLVMDGLSTDDTIKIAQSYNDPRIRIYSASDKGIYDAMNKGIKNAHGEWLYFLGSDDWLINKDVFHVVFSQNINEFDVVYGDVEAPHLASVHAGEWSLDTIDYNRCHQAILYKKTVFKRLGIYNLKYKIWADYDLNLKWFFDKKLKNKYIQTKIAHYSQGGFSSYQVDKKMLDILPWLKLIRGHRMYTLAEKKNLVIELLKNKVHAIKRKIHSRTRTLQHKISIK
jgi:glycosyltransferase involved in cell wall biosynthesis